MIGSTSTRARGRGSGRASHLVGDDCHRFRPPFARFHFGGQEPRRHACGTKWRRGPTARSRSRCSRSGRSRRSSPGGTTVVVSYWLIIAGPSILLPAASASRAKKRVGSSSAPHRREPRFALVPQRRGRRFLGAGDLPHRSGGISPIPRTRMFGISMSEPSKRREYSRSCASWKSPTSRAAQASSISPDPASTRSS